MSVTQQNTKVLAVTTPVAILDDGTWATTEIDTQGFEYLQIFFMLGAVDIAMTACKVQESATSASGMTDVPGLVMGTSNNTTGSTSTLPSDSADGLIYCFELDLRARERFIDPVFTIGDGSIGGFACAWAVLSRGLDVPQTAVERGISQILRV